MKTTPILLKKLVANPYNPNIISKSNLIKIARNIGKTGLYEPLIVRPFGLRRGASPRRVEKGYYQLINGYHRCRVLMKLGYRNADCIIWNVDDIQTNVFLATLNRLGGHDDVYRRINLLKDLLKKVDSNTLSKVVLQTKAQIEKLVNLHISTEEERIKKPIFEALIFFVNESQKETIEKALSKAQEQITNVKSNVARRSAALTLIAEVYLAKFA